MSEKIYEVKDLIATKFAGPERRSGERTMIQIDQGGRYVQLSPDVLRGVLVAYEESTLPVNVPDGGKYRLVASAQLDGGRLEARWVIGEIYGEVGLQYVLAVDSAPNTPAIEVVLQPDRAQLLIAMQTFANGESR